MQIKRFEARDMAAALRKVKKEFGEQAVILSAKTIKQPGRLFGTRRSKGVEITAASDRFPKPNKKAPGRLDTVIPAVMPDPANPLETELPVKTVVKSKPQVSASPPSIPAKAPAKGSHGPTVAQRAAMAKPPKPGPELERFKRALLAQDISADLTTRMVHSVTTQRGDAAVDASADLNARFERLLKEQLRFAASDRPAKNGPTVIALVGPTGVGKTTTTAKLAAAFSTREGARVGLVSLDHQRIGGTAQLEVLARVMDLPLTVIKAQREIKAALARMRPCDIILVDTPGVSANRFQDLKKLDQLLKPFCPDEVHLLLTATTKDRDLQLLCEQFNRVGYNRLIFTKLDETSVYGNLLNLMSTNKTPLAYLTDSPQVPEGLTTATADAVIALFTPLTGSSLSPSGSAACNLPKLGAMGMLGVQQDYFVANRNSDIFHQPDCKAVKRINPENILVFKNMAEAKTQNFKPCRMCCAVRLSKKPAFETFRVKAVNG
jgi:flagellar biosynthesis protein FlhF